MIFEKQIVNTYCSQFLNRCDDTGNVFYFSAGDFEGLRARAYQFPAAAGHMLRGFFYSYPNPIPGRLIVFDHGFGGGHTAYMKEIELLCRHGYLVFSYDHTGCMASGGASPNGLAQSLSDLNDCITALKADGTYKAFDISVMGHSWGGFSCLNIAALHPEISHIVVLSGFVSVERLIGQFFGGILKSYRKSIMDIETANNPRFVGFDAVQTLSQTDAKVLLVYSSDDKTVNKAIHFDTLKAGLEGKDNIRFLLVDGKGHNPNYTADAVSYKDGFFADLTKRTKKKQLQTSQQKKAFIDSYDWNRMTAQDEAVWAEIFRTMDA